MAAGVNFWGYESEAGLVGVMGRQDLAGVTLIRHAYVDPAAQRQGVGARLLAHLLEVIPHPVLVGTWAAAWWAIRFYEKHGFRLVTQEEKDRLLRTYWTISPRQVETSVVLADGKVFVVSREGARFGFVSARRHGRQRVESIDGRYPRKELAAQSGHVLRVRTVEVVLLAEVEC